MSYGMNTLTLAIGDTVTNAVQIPPRHGGVGVWIPIGDTIAVVYAAVSYDDGTTYVDVIDPADGQALVLLDAVATHGGYVDLGVYMGGFAGKFRLRYSATQTAAQVATLYVEEV